MNVVYRVVVTEEHTDGSGVSSQTDYRTIFEAAGRDRAALLRFVPDEVAAALDGDEPETPERSQDAATGDKPKRRRRTKAEIAADEAAAAVAAGQAAIDEHHAPPAPAPAAAAPVPAAAAPVPAEPYNPFAG